jgi:thiamine-monophosphate kinase
VEWLREAGIKPTSMIDISDGLSSELLHICRKSEVGCVLFDEKIPIHDDTRKMALEFHTDPTACALSGGEDYELLFTISQSDFDKVDANGDISVVGFITPADKGTVLRTRSGNDHPLVAQGWNAFKQG